MELRHLRYFLAVANSHSFTRAAELLHVSQPTLSHQIKQLESILGSVLFDRSAKSVVLTASGRLFKPYCERIVQELEASRLALSELEGLASGSLRMGLFHSFPSSLLPRVLAEFQQRYPAVNVTASLVPRLELERKLLGGDFDLAVTYDFEDAENFGFEGLSDEELVLVVGSAHAHAKSRSLPMRELSNLPLVLLTPEFGIRQLVDKFFVETGLPSQIVLEMNAIELILATVRNSQLATVLSMGSVSPDKGQHIIRLTDPAPRRTIGILWGRHGRRSPAAKRMAEMIRAAYRPQENSPERALVGAE